MCLSSVCGCVCVCVCVCVCTRAIPHILNEWRAGWSVGTVSVAGVIHEEADIACDDNLLTHGGQAA